MRVSLSLQEDANQEYSTIYNMLMTNDSTALEADEVLEMIQRDKEGVIKKRQMAADAIKHRDVWEESHALRPYTEGRMIRRSERSDGTVVSTSDESSMRNLL